MKSNPPWNKKKIQFRYEFSWISFKAFYVSGSKVISNTYYTSIAIFGHLCIIRLTVNLYLSINQKMDFIKKWQVKSIRQTLSQYIGQHDVDINYRVFCFLFRSWKWKDIGYPKTFSFLSVDSGDLNYLNAYPL